MKAHDKNPYRQLPPLDKVGVDLVLTQPGPEDPGPCLSDETLASWIDGRLTPAQRSSVAAHLDRCPACYAQWLSVASAMETAKVKGPIGRRPVFVPRFQKKSPVLAGVGLALAACLLWFFFSPFAGGRAVEGLILKSYRTAIDHKITVIPTESALGPVFPWDHPQNALGFSEDRSYPASVRAFGAGLWDGWNRLATPDRQVEQPAAFVLELKQAPATPAQDEVETIIRTYFLLGRWCICLKAVTRAGGGTALPPAFWETQHEIGSHFVAALTARSDASPLTKSILTALHQISSAVEGLARDAQPERNRKKAAAEIDLLISRIFEQ